MVFDFASSQKVSSRVVPRQTLSFLFGRLLLLEEALFPIYDNSIKSLIHTQREEEGEGERKRGMGQGERDFRSLLSSHHRAFSNIFSVSCNFSHPLLFPFSSPLKYPSTIPLYLFLSFVLYHASPQSHSTHDCFLISWLLRIF